MNKGFYRKLALSNIKKNAQVYFPYILSGIFIVAMFYIIHALSQNESLLKLPRGGETLKEVLLRGRYIIGFISVLVLCYTNGFILKGRQKELGLYQILGMNKRNIEKVLIWETFFIAITVISLGSLMGILLSKLMYLVLLSIVAFEIPIEMGVSGTSVIVGALLFLITYSGILVYNISSISYLNPIELLRGADKGEKEPKSNPLLSLIGFITLGIGYYISLTNEFSVDVLGAFLLATFLVVIGTYCLFIAGISLILKFLCQLKKIYYHPRYFTVISGMLYRMKRHAIGLASICILSTMVIITLSVTTSLYFGNEDVVRQRFPYEFQLTSPTLDQDGWNYVRNILSEQFESSELEPKNLIDFSVIRLWAWQLEEGVVLERQTIEGRDELTDWENTQLFIIDEATFNTLTNQTITLHENEVLLYGWEGSHLIIEGREFDIKENLTEFPDVAHINFGLSLVVSDLNLIDELVNSINDEADSVFISHVHRIRFDLNLNQQEGLNFSQQLRGTLAEQFPDDEAGRFMDVRLIFQSRSEIRQEVMATYGGLMFVGIFVGVLFLLATGLIIFYKQISEGFEDQQRYEIMKKVGMSQKEIRKTIHTQILWMFFLPLVMAIIHNLFAFNITLNILELFELNNVGLFRICLGITIGTFIIVYGILYSLTAKTYERLVNQ